MPDYFLLFTFYLKMYRPISCDYYDELTLFAMQRKSVCIVYKNTNDSEEKIEAILKDIVTREKEEFLILNDSREIRLDKIISVDGKKLSSYC